MLDKKLKVKVGTQTDRIRHASKSKKVIIQRNGKESETNRPDEAGMNKEKEKTTDSNAIAHWQTGRRN